MIDPDPRHGTQRARRPPRLHRPRAPRLRRAEPGLRRASSPARRCDVLYTHGRGHGALRGLPRHPGHVRVLRDARAPRPRHAARGLRAGGAARVRAALQDVGRPLQRRSRDPEQATTCSTATSRTLIGVMPPRFAWGDADLWIPEKPRRGLDAVAGRRSRAMWFFLGHLKPGVSIRQAEAGPRRRGPAPGHGLPEGLPEALQGASSSRSRTWSWGASARPSSSCSRRWASSCSSAAATSPTSSSPGPPPARRSSPSAPPWERAAGGSCASSSWRASLLALARRRPGRVHGLGRAQGAHRRRSRRRSSPRRRSSG